MLTFADSCLAAIPSMGNHTRQAEMVEYVIIQRATDEVVYRAEIRFTGKGIKCTSCGRADDLLDGLLLEIAGESSIVMIFQRTDGALMDLRLERTLSLHDSALGKVHAECCLLVV